MDLSFDFLGVRVFVHWTTLLLGLYVWWIGFDYIKERQPYESKSRYVIAGLVGMVATIISMVAHEVGHAVVATGLGIKITEAGIFGLAAYVIPEKLILEYAPWQIVLVVLAGPLTNFLLAAIAAIFVRWFPESLGKNTLRYVAWANLVLGRWSLYPITVFDGGRVVTALLMWILRISSAQALLPSVAIMLFFFFLIFAMRPNLRILEDRLEKL